MRIGFGRRDITPRVGVDLAGFGPFRNRHSIAVRDRLWARAMAVEQGGVTAVVVSCDLIGVPRAMSQAVRKLVTSAAGVPAEAIMVHCTHTHSGPSTGRSIGWGDPDAPYLEILPGRIAGACIEAVERLREAALSHSEVPCEGMSYNREYNVREKDPNVVLRQDWRPARPELTDTTAHVFKAQADGRTIGFFSYFGCHPVVCCEETRYIHGDYAGVATNKIEQENPGATGLFLQGAQGDINTCFVHHPEEISLRALDVIAERYARSVRAGLVAAKPLAVDAIRCALREVTFRRASWDLDKLRAMLAEKESVLHAPNADDAASDVRLATVYVIALRRLIALRESGQPFEDADGRAGNPRGPHRVPRIAPGDLPRHQAGSGRESQCAAPAGHGHHQRHPRLRARPRNRRQGHRLRGGLRSAHGRDRAVRRRARRTGARASFPRRGSAIVPIRRLMRTPLSRLQVPVLIRA